MGDDADREFVVNEGHPFDEKPDLFVHRRSATTILAKPPKEQDTPSLPPPPIHRFRLDDFEGVFPIWPDGGDNDPKEAIKRAELGPTP